MRRKVIWSNHKRFIFVDILKKELGIEGELEDEEIAMLLEKYKVENDAFLKEQILKKFDKVSNNEIIGFAVTYNENRVRNQLAIVLGNNYSDIFNLPFDKATWYTDSWNIKADIEYQGTRYYYTFRVLKPNTKRDIIDNINKGRPMLTSTYLGHYTKTILNK